jgi:photosystem II stability/assembly factor-like uncharacterized protein
MARLRPYAAPAVLALVCLAGVAASALPGAGGGALTPMARLESQAPPTTPAPATPAADAGPVWRKLETEPYRGKQDDIFFLNPDLGWYVNGAGKIFKTTDGGATWKLQLHKPGTYFRCVAFLDEKRGFAGNIGTDYFPGVTDTTPLYATADGGDTWTPVKIDGLPADLKGLCAIDVYREPFINAGTLAYRTTVRAAGRVGGPAFLLTSQDEGTTWRVDDLRPHCGMILDVKFVSREVGYLCAATDAAVQKSNALVLRTADGGKTWKPVYRSERPFELTWKCAFPTEKTGYVTVQNYDPDEAVIKRVVAKTEDGGATWKELALVDDHKEQEFGVGFLDDKTGWVGGYRTGFFTRDGGATWTKTDMGQAVNKIRLLPPKEKGGTPAGYAIGVGVYRLTVPQPSS